MKRIVDNINGLNQNFLKTESSIGNLEEITKNK